MKILWPELPEVLNPGCSLLAKIRGNSVEDNAEVKRIEVSVLYSFV